MNAGAARAEGGALLFLHADTRLPPEWSRVVAETLRRPGVAAGAFRFRLAGDFVGKSLIEWGTGLRSRYLQKPYGDQALFLSRAMFEELGGFANLPIMEDYELVSRLRRRGRIVTAHEAILTSARRWQRLGVFRATFINQLVLAGYHLRVHPETLAKLYRRTS
jgi:rSAM/selenodomain-associated transferase 2